MSTLKVNDIEEATSGGSKIFMVRAWFNYKNSGGNSLLEDGGVSSVTDTGTGTFRAAFDIAFTNINYASAGSCNTNNTTAAPAVAFNTSNGANTNTTTQRGFASEDVDAGFTDYIMNTVMLLGNH